MKKKNTHSDEKIIVIRCFETKRKSSSIYKSETKKKKGKVFNPKLLKPSSFTLIQTKSLKDTLTRSSVHRNQSLYNRSHRIYIYIYSILLVVKEFKKKRRI